MLDSQCVLSLVGSVVDGFVGLVLGSVDSSILGVLSGLLCSVNLILDSSGYRVFCSFGSIAYRLQQTVHYVFSISLGNSSKSSSGSGIVTYEGLHLIGVLLQEFLNFGNILLGHLGIALDKLGNLLLDGGQYFCKLAGVASLQLLGQCADRCLGGCCGLILLSLV